NHGWYDNLDLTVEQLAARAREGDLVMDYSGGTGILAGRVLERWGSLRAGIVIVDSSPKFLRLALEKLGGDERVAFRLLRYLKEAKRLQLPTEVLGDTLVRR